MSFSWNATCRIPTNPRRLEQAVHNCLVVGSARNIAIAVVTHESALTTGFEGEGTVAAFRYSTCWSDLSAEVKECSNALSSNSLVNVMEGVCSVGNLSIDVECERIVVLQLSLLNVSASVIKL
jgi:hypothetical protein